MNRTCLVIAPLLALGLVACASSPDDVDGHGQIPTPSPNGGKGDGERPCGGTSCDASLCGFDCSQAGAPCVEACTTEGRPNAFVAATITGAESASVDSRLTPYVPRWALDNVMIYGCDLWSFSSGKQGLEIELTELIHSSFVVNPADPTRDRNRLDVYISPFASAGDYAAEGSYQPSSEAAAAGRRYTTAAGCTAHITNTAGIAGTFSCNLANANGSTVTMTGQFACPGNAVDSPIFVAWTPSA